MKNIIKKLFYYKTENNNYYPCFKWYSKPCHAGFIFSFGSYFNNHLHLQINLFFGKLIINSHLKINKTPNKIGAFGYKQYGFEFTNFEGCEHLLYIYIGKKIKIFDMPWKLVHFRTTYYSNKMTPFCHDYSYSKWIMKRYKNVKMNNYDLIYYYIINNKENFITKFNFTYNLNGEVQNRIAEVYVTEKEWRRKWLRYCKIGNEVNRYLELTFNKETGKKVGTWKGGVISMNFKMKDNETINDAFIRFTENIQNLI